jgi:hypothetical protein
MKYRNCMIAWTPTAYVAKEDEATKGQVKVGPHPDTTGWSDAYSHTTGSCYFGRKKAPRWERLSWVMSDFHTMVVRDGIDAQVAHKAFLAIDEYREFISPDIDGAE